MRKDRNHKIMGEIYPKDPIFKKLIFDCFTGKDNKTFDVLRILLFMSCVVFCFLSIFDTFKGHSFNPMEFGTGLGLVLAGGGGGLGLKSRTEPSPKDK
jgi:hypothetical protein